MKYEEILECVLAEVKKLDPEQDLYYVYKILFRLFPQTELGSLIFYHYNLTKEDKEGVFWWASFHKAFRVGDWCDGYVKEGIKNETQSESIDGELDALMYFTLGADDRKVMYNALVNTFKIMEEKG